MTNCKIKGCELLHDRVYPPDFTKDRSRFEHSVHYVACKECKGNGWIDYQDPTAPSGHDDCGCYTLQEVCSACDGKDDDDPNTWGWEICESAYYCDTDEHHKIEGYNPED